ncbi:sigma 54-interacting transcriptional regulator [Planococcus halocryophilus]|uniref:sigma 54-interacting transcriptional regulator n=1 Tax=Planococcus halocryophilus TaxID=1215089 RepID=UPI001F1072C1|nr:sigma 54-interacting transcriptional regulator [Planococcus halocryophilus]MCH4825360.1 sigma 54-interacting transcriptional regulator [Planococcus halocryophilus]
MNNHSQLIDLIPMGLIFFDRDYKITQLNKFAERKLYCNKAEVIGRYWDDVFPRLFTEELRDEEAEIFQFKFAEESFVAKKSLYFLNEDSGFSVFFQTKSSLEEFTQELDSYQDLVLDLKTIFDTSYDVIYVSDGEGKTLRVSAACEALWGYKESDLIGKTVYQLEEEGVFKPSVTRLVLEKKEKVSFIQTTKTGRRLMVVGTPVKDNEGNVIRVINASRDVTEVKELESEVDLLRQMTEGYRQEIEGFRAREEIEKEIISRSEKMKSIVSFSQKIAKVDSTVLLLGESGVGKEVIASFIHKWSNRNNHPFITLNCGSMPSNILEAELFGYENKEREMGLIEMANSGTLFLEQIEEMPMSTQIKFLKALQGKGNKVKTSNIRIITASSKNLRKKVEEGDFREDLYYLLNVVPIMIPPLRERNEDIIPLIIHFTEQLNQKYSEEKKFQPRVLRKLQEYSWPGNVQELQNIIERLFVTSEGGLIELEDLPEYINVDNISEKTISINKIMPLKEAVALLEKELLEMTEKKYGSTTKIAEVLQVNQSTISRKLQKYTRGKN